MARYLLMAFTNPTPGHENEFNDWYDTVHLPDLLRIPGISGAERFRPAPSQIVTQSGVLWVIDAKNASISDRYLALYSIETDDIAAVLGQVTSRAGTAEMKLSPALGDAYTLCFQLLS